MNITYLNPDGVHQAEKKALIKIGEALPNEWRGYASLEMLDRQQGSSEIDLIVITPYHVVLVELKQIHGKLTSDGKYWYKNGSRLYKSPVNVTELKAKKLKQKIQKKLESKLARIPYVKSCVVIYGNVNRDNLTEDEKGFVCELDAFLRIGKSTQYKNILGLDDWEQRLQSNQRPNNQIKIWNNFLSKKSSDFDGKSLTIQGYTVDGDALFEHPNFIYREYFSQKSHDPNYKALMRCWDFSAPKILNRAQTLAERQLIGLRESKVLGYIDTQDESLAESHFSLVYVPEPEEITVDFVEMYEWPRTRLRLDEFIEKYKNKLKSNQRLDLMQSLVSHLARLHTIDVAHRDLGGHSIWLSLPSKVVLSNFLTASYPDPHQQTVRSARDILRTCRISIPEDLLEDPDGTARTRDVYLAGACAHYIAYGVWPQKTDDIYSWAVREADPFSGLLNSWFEKMLHLEAAERYPDMIAALDAFNKVCEKSNKPTDLVEVSNELFVSDCNIWQEYSPQPISQPRGTEMSLRSTEHNVGIKLWNGVSQINSDGSNNYQLTSFLYKVKLFKNANLTSTVSIKDFGYNPSLSCLFVIYDWIEGEPWSEWLKNNKEDDDLVTLTIQKLLTSFLQLHKNQLNHGDLHPGNIILTSRDEELIPVFIDFFDYQVDAQTPYNPAYLPENYENLSVEALDRYGVVKIVNETAALYGLSDLVGFSESLLQQTEVSEGDIGRLADNLNEKVSPSLDNKQTLFAINPSIHTKFALDLTNFNNDEDVYYVTIKTGQERRGNGSLILRVYISTFSQQLGLHINPETKLLERAFLDDISYAQYTRNYRDADIELVGSITGYQENVTEDLIDWILTQPITAEQITFKNPKLEDLYRESLNVSEFSEMSTRLLWKTFIGTEDETLPRVIATQRSEKLRNGDLLVYYSQYNQPLNLDLANETYFIKKDADHDFKRIGRLEEISSGALRIKPFWIYTTIEAGEGIRVEGNLSASSLKKRTEATETIVKGRSIIANLPDYFDPKKEIEPIYYPGEISEGDLDLYDELGENGKLLFSLNEKQRESFRQLYNYGPVGLLQGPPGTGKTAFISSFIHHILSKGASKVLLVSQSHEAVNNAAEKIRLLFQRQDVELGIVRLGDEGNLSDPLLDIHEKAVQEHYRNKFQAEYKTRLFDVLSHLGLPTGFINDCLDFEVSFGDRFNTLIRLKSSQKETEDDDSNYQSDTLKEKFIGYFERTFETKWEFDTSLVENFSNNFYEHLCLKYNVYSPKNVAKARQMIGLSKEWLDVLSSSRANFQNFLVKTRTLVCGTCVGIGRVHYGISENIYDWVIIDEAARSSASELAIAMQVGRRILLVGDHMQLPPMYEEDHLKAVHRRLPKIPDKEISISDFERCFLSPYGNEIGQTLPYQYRMAPAIGGMVSSCFYHDVLQTKRGEPVSWVRNLPNGLGSTVTWVDTASTGSQGGEQSVFGARNQSPSKMNEHEISIILQLVAKITESDSFANLVENRHEPPIGIICMYDKQRRQMLKKFNQADWSRTLIEKQQVKIDTVDGYQGKENSIIIVSLVRNNKQKKIGFLAGQFPAATKRTNVAISRAKERLYIVGSSIMFTEQNEDSALGKVYSYIQTHSQEDDFTILNSNEITGV